MFVHTRLARPLNVLGKGVGGHGEDGDGRGVGPVQAPDGLSGRDAVHDGHTHIHEHGVVMVLGRGAEHLHGLLPVTSPVHGRVAELQQRAGDFHIDFIVFHKQDASSREILFLHGKRVGGLSAARGLEQHVLHDGLEYGFGNEEVHPRLTRPGLDFRPVISRHDDHQRIGPHDAADGAGRFHAVHVRHFPVHKRDVVAGVPLQGRFDAGDGRLS